MVNYLKVAVSRQIKITSSAYIDNPGGGDRRVQGCCANVHSLIRSEQIGKKSIKRKYVLRNILINRPSSSEVKTKNIIERTCQINYVLHKS